MSEEVDELEIQKERESAQKSLAAATELAHEAQLDAAKAKARLNSLNRQLEDKRSETEKNRAYIERQKQIQVESFQHIIKLRRVNVESGLMSEAEAARKFPIERAPVEAKTRQQKAARK